MRKKILLLSINIIFVILITGCWNYSEMEDRLLVAGFSVDQGKGEVPYLVTVEVLIPKSETSMDTALVQADGYTILMHCAILLPSRVKSCIWDTAGPW